MKKYLKGAKVKFAHREVPAPLTIWGFSKRGAHEETFDSTPRPLRGEPAPEHPPPSQTTTVADYYRDKVRLTFARLALLGLVSNPFTRPSRLQYNIALNHPTWPCVELKEKRMRVPVELVIVRLSSLAVLFTSSEALPPLQLLPCQPVGFTLFVHTLYPRSPSLHADVAAHLLSAA